MSNLVISLLLTLGTSTWIYSKLTVRNRENLRQTLTAVGVAAVLIFIFSLSILDILF